MEFGWINVFGAIIVVLMLIPNIIYALKNKGEKNRCTNRFMNTAEQIGRYMCIVLMWLPLLVWKFGFFSVRNDPLFCREWLPAGCILGSVCMLYEKKDT